MAKENIEFDVFGLFGADDRGTFLVPFVGGDDSPIIRLASRPGGGSRGWTITGLYEFGPDVTGGSVVLEVRISLPYDLKRITLRGALELAAVVHQATFPSGDHRFFETVTIDREAFEIRIGCGS